LENNINILCEKPLANSYQTALEIKRMVERSSVQFMMGFTLRFFDWYQSAFELIQENKLGDVMFASATYASPLPQYSWFFEKAKSGGGVIIDRGAHMIDLVTWLFGIPKKVQACILNKRNMNVEENAFVTLIHEDSISQLVLSYGVNKQRDRIEIYGTACNLIVDCNLGLSLFLPSSESMLKQFALKLPKKAIKSLLQSKSLIKKNDDPYFKEISYFVKCLKEGNKVSPDYLDGFNNIKIIDACYKSIKEEKTIDVV
jgi:predicted dehydrogenase